MRIDSHQIIDYTAILRNELTERCRHNARYSLRAFARDIGFSPSRLSDILNHRKGLSTAGAAQIAKALAMTESETAMFCDMVEWKHAKVPQVRSRLAARILAAQSTGTLSQYHEMSDDEFQMVSAWYHLAILELFELKTFRQDSRWIASQLGISVLETSEALERLKRLGLIHVRNDQTLTRVYDATTTTHDTPSKAIREYHHDLLKRAHDAIERQTVHDRDFSAMTMAINRSKLVAAKMKIRAFRRELAAFLECSEDEKDSVYALSIQLFSLTPVPTLSPNDASEGVRSCDVNQQKEYSQ